MKIIIGQNKVDFSTLKTGQTFIDPEYDNDTVLMVVEPAIDVDITTDREIAGREYAGYAVDLSTGAIIGYGSAEQVTPVDTILTVEKAY